MSKAGLLIATVVLGLSAAPTASGQDLETFYGPETFTKVNWKPVTYQRAVDLEGHQAPFVLHVRNGDANGRHRLVLGWVAVDGRQVLGPLDLLSRKTLHEVAISPTGPFTLKVCLLSRPRAELTIWIEGAAGAGGLPPDPAEIAPPLDQTVPTSLADATAFLYSGDEPVQEGVAPGTIDRRRTVVLRGKVSGEDGAVLPGVRITVNEHPEFGSTVSRADGVFDMVVNGGGPLTVRYDKAGYLSADRKTETPWQNYVWLPDVTLIELDPNATHLDFSASAPLQAARGSVVTDDTGTRQATIVAPAGGSMVNMQLPDGTVLPALSGLTIRATEYTVGPSGPSRMPAELPPLTGYTYAVELTADEALAAGATTVTFDPPLAFYLENFIGFPVGLTLPSASYDRDRAAWMCSPNGRVIGIVGIADGRAEIDLTGDGVAEPPEELEGLGIEDAERAYLATAYDSGQSLWRVPIPHLSSVDINLPVKPVSEDAEAPAEEPEAATTGDDPCSKTGSSSIECQNQTLGERVQLAGIPFGLNYRSDRSRGRKDLFRVRIPLGSEPLPTDLLRIDLTVSIAGRTLNRSFTPEPDQEFTFEWDGTDAYGRAVQGSALAQVTVGYVYDGVYVGPQDVDPAFATTDGVPLDVPARLEATLRRTWSVPLGTLSAEGLGLGGWSVAVHHTYDPTRRVLYRGDGSKRQASAMGSVITTAARIGAFGVAVAPDGSYYVAQSTRVSKVSPDGVITPFAGTGVSGYSGDGGPASEAQLNGAYSVALGPDGSLYIADWYNYRVREVTPDGTIWTVAGDGEPGEPGEGDGGPATSASLAGPSFVAVSLDGTLAFADAGRVRMVLPCGEIVSVAGAGGPGSTGDGGPAIDAGFYRLGGVAWSPDGTLYATDALSVRRIGPDGIIDTAVGPEAFLGPDGEQYYPASVAVGPEGSLYVGFQYGHHIRRVAPDGTSTVFACGFEEGFSGDGGPPAAALCAHVAGVAVAPDGAVYVLDSANSRVRRVSAPLPGLGVDELLIAAGDAPEVYRFDSTGRHLETRHALTGATLYDFSYDPAGRLAEIHDGDGNVIRIERDGAGRPTAVVSPSGVRTVLAVDGSGHLERVTNPAGEGVQVVHDPAGLLLSLTNPRGLSVSYTYDGGGRLTAAQGPDGGTKSFQRTAIAGGFEVAELSAAGRQSLYRVEQLATGGTRSINQTGAGRGVLTEMRPDGSAHVTTSDGTTWTIAGGVDPRFGRQSSFAAGLTLQTPGGLVASQTKTVTATLGDPGDPFSLTSWQKSVAVAGRTVTTTFDAQTRTLLRTLPSGRSAELVLNPMGRPVSRASFSLTPTAYEYDSAGRLVALRRGDRSAGLGYDERGYVSTLMDSFSRATELERDPAGRITSRSTPDGRVFEYGYDAQGNLTSLTLPSGATHTFTYGTRGLLGSYQAPGTSSPLRREYDLDGRLLGIALPDGRTIERGYDAKGRLARVDFDRGAILREYDDVSGQLVRLVAPDGGSLTYEFDGSVLTGFEWAGAVSGKVEDRLDGALRLAERRVNGVQAGEYEYDEDGFLVRAGDLSIVRDAQTGLITSTAMGGVTTSHGYTALGEPREMHVQVDGTEVLAVELGRDRAGRVVEKTETVEGVVRAAQYGYDAADRLGEATVNGTVTLYAYDVNGNRSLRQSGAESWPASFDQQDRLTTMGPYAYEYGPAGDLRRRVRTDTGAVTEYAYDATGNLVRVHLPGGDEIEYVLDPIGRRLGRRVNGTLVQGLLYKDRLRPAAELDGAGNVVSLFVYGEHPNVPSYMIRGGTEYRIVTDHAGSPRLVIEVGGGAIAQRMDYDAFGRVLVDTQPGFQPFGFAGGLYDPDTGLVRFGERDYDAETGRWTTKDRSLFTGRTENLYAYVSNDPLNRVDRWGRALCYLGPTAGLAPDEYCEEVPPGTFEEDCDDPEDHCQQVGRNYDGSYSDDWSIDGGTAGGSTKTACDEEMVTCDIESITTDEQRSGEGPSPDGRDIGEDLDKEMKDDMDRKDLEEKEGDAAGPKPCP